MWIVELALRRPYTVAVMSLLILVMGILSLTRMVVDIFPTIDIPVVAVVWNYPGLPAEDMERRVVLITERAFSTTVNGIERIESQSIPGIGMLHSLLPAGHRHRRGHRADLVGVVDASAHRAAGDAAAQRHPVQRLERAGRAADRVERDAARGEDLRLRAQLHPRPAVHHPRSVDAGAVRRQAAADQRRHRSGGAGRQGPVAGRRGQRAARRRTSSCRRARRASATASTTCVINSARRPRSRSSTTSRSRSSAASRCCSATSRTCATATPTRPTSCASTASAPPTSRS